MTRTTSSTEHVGARARRLAAGAALLCCACAPVEAPDAGPPPAPGWVVSRPFPDIESLNDVVALGEGRAYAVGTGGALLRAVDGAWTREDGPVDVDLESVSAVRDDESGEETVVAVGAEGAVLSRGEDGWRALDSGTTAHLFGVWVRAPGDAFVVGEAGTILRVVDGVVTSMAEQAAQQRTNPDGTVETYPIPESLKDVGGGGASDVVAVGARGAVYHFDGERWSREDADTSRPISDVFTGAGVWATATDGVVMRRHGFSDWDTESFRAPAPVFLQGVWTDGDVLVAVGFSGSVFVRHDGEWETVPLSDALFLRGVSGVVVTPPEDEVPGVYDIFAVGGGGRIARGPTALPDQALDGAPDAGAAAGAP